jgi:hypothetical protein
LLFVLSFLQFVTNDHRIRGSAKLEVVYLDELEAGVA